MTRDAIARHIIVHRADRQHVDRPLAVACECRPDEAYAEGPGDTRLFIGTGRAPAGGRAGQVDPGRSERFDDYVTISTEISVPPR